VKKYIGIDLGGTNIALGIVGEDKKIKEQMSVPVLAERAAKEGIQDIIFAVYKLLSQSNLSLNEIETIGIGVPGTANKETGVLEYANNLNMDGEPFIALLEKEFHKKILFDNDGNAAAWGEYLAGVGQGVSSFMMVTLGTGVGAGIILNGDIYQGCNYAAGELGHMVMQMNGRPCTCGRSGCMEAYVSATALIEMAQEAMKEERATVLWEMCEGTPALMNGKIVFDAVRKEDFLARKLLADYVEYLAIGVTNIINLLQPEMLCIGGGISRSGDLFLPLLKEKVNRWVYTRDSKVKTEITTAQLYNDAGIIGAAFLPK